MGLFSALDTGYSGLNTSQTALSVVSHNISNANSDFYTRQRAVIQAKDPFHGTPGEIGTGSNVQTVIRIHDEFTFERLRNGANAYEFDKYSQDKLMEVAKYFPDLDELGLQNDLKNYFNSWNDFFASNPNDSSQKIALVQNAITFTDNLSQTRDKLRDIQDSLNDELKLNLEEVNRIGEQIAKLNGEIATVETIEPNRANDLRDQRDNLELTLAKLMDISIYKGRLQTDNVYDTQITDMGRDYFLNIAGHSFVDGTTFHPLEISNENNESSYYSIYHVTQDLSKVDITEHITGGKIGAILDIRGGTIDSQTGYPESGKIQQYIEDLDTFAKGFVEATNSIYAKSAQDNMASASMAIESNTVLLNTDENFKEGTFDVVVYDMDGDEVARREVSIDASTTMTDIQNAINDANTDDNQDNNSMNDVDDYFQAVYNYSTSNGLGEFALTPKNGVSGYKVAVEDGGSNFPGVMGVSQFFTGTSGSDIDVKTEFKNDPTAVNAWKAPVLGNNEVANEMIELQYDKIEFIRSDGEVFEDNASGFYRFLTSQIASDGEVATRSADTSEALHNAINDEYQSISGVNMDEELANLMKFQTAYGASAKIITTIDQMLTTLLSIKRQRSNKRV